MLFAFLCLHEIGAHYTYPGVPYDAWIGALTGGTLEGGLGLERNHFDRLAHFAFGLLLTQPMREVLMRTSPLRGRWTFWLAVAVSMAASAGYEIAEWWVAALFGGDLGTAFLGAQGDVWDAQKDMGLASLGAMLAMTVATNVENAARRKAPPARVQAADASRPLTIP
jgi:putative membrane protein